MDLPAPEYPITPTIDPSSTLTVTSSTAVVEERRSVRKLLVTPRSSMTAVIPSGP